MPIFCNSKCLRGTELIKATHMILLILTRFNHVHQVYFANTRKYLQGAQPNIFATCFCFCVRGV